MRLVCLILVCLLLLFLGSRFSAASGGQELNREEPDTVLVRLRDGTKKALRPILADGYVLLRDFSEGGAPIAGLFCLRKPAGAKTLDCVKKLKERKDVVYAEVNVPILPDYTPNDPDFYRSWGLYNTGQNYKPGWRGSPDADIDAPETWDSERGSNSVVVAVIDSGINYNHKDLSANIWNNADEIAGNGVDDDGNGYVDDVRGWDFVSSDNDPLDEDGHGTAVAGVIGAQADNLRGSCGVCHHVSIMPVRILPGTVAEAVAGIQYAVSNGAHIINTSWGVGAFSRSLSDAVTLARNAGVLFVVAAGNDGQDNDAVPHYPSSFTQDNIISVAASTSQDELAYFSDYGRVSVDLAAPGEDIFSTDLSGYSYWSGTSFSAPFVSGVAALIKSAEPAITYDQLRTRIISNVTKLNSLSGKVSSGGRLNAYDAFRQAVPTVTIFPLSSVVLGPGQSLTVSWQSSKDGTYSVEVGGDGTPGSGFQIESGTCQAYSPVNSTVYETDLPDNTSASLFVIVTSDSFSGFTSVTLTDDQMPPGTRITYPFPGSSLSFVRDIRGTASDAGAAGVAAVLVCLYDGEFYYDGTDFTLADEVWLPTTGGQEWRFDTSAITWQNGRTYIIKAKAQDSVGNADNSPASCFFSYYFPYKITKNVGGCSLVRRADSTGLSPMIPLALLVFILWRRRDAMKSVKWLSGILFLLCQVFLETWRLDNRRFLRAAIFGIDHKRFHTLSFLEKFQSPFTEHTQSG